MEAEASERAAAEERWAAAPPAAAVEAAARKAPAAGEAAATGLGGAVPGSPLRRRRATPYPPPSHPAEAAGSDATEAELAGAGPGEAQPELPPAEADPEASG